MRDEDWVRFAEQGGGESEHPLGASSALLDVIIDFCLARLEGARRQPSNLPVQDLREVVRVITVGLRAIELRVAFAKQHGEAARDGDEIRHRLKRLLDDEALAEVVELHPLGAMLHQVAVAK